ncbi:transcription termination factor NusA [Treponema sp. JC4]|uniref:transcription termination factor NusA n=1 Tax=Treponema sp. JC4 TaxID=1124982 RepID=UPI00025B0A4E|nr:transcription termination factor NusA [Treponema sp. JC4]EID85436.1 transcription termination factor NusA [Treponema sp. JC4]
MSEMAEAIRRLIEEKGYSEESVRQTIEKALKAAYKKRYGTDENAIVKFADDMSDVSLFSRKVVIDGVYDPTMEIELEEARALAGDEIEEGDEIDILEDPKSYERSEVSTGKQTAHQGLNETYKTSLYNEYKDKVGEIIIGYYQRERNGNIYVDLGNAGRLEGVLPVKYQSKLEFYDKNDRIKALIVDIKPTNSGIQLILSRSDPKLVCSILEKEVPEIADGTVEIVKAVRDAGYRTKIAVSTKREEVDPVGACVGLKGVRIQNVIRELLNEKIDVLKYESDPAEFIKNALSPAQVNRVVIMDAEKRQALAIVDESQFSLAIGRQGQNVRLANRLCDWNIDVKTEEQAADIDFSNVNTVQNARALFNDEAAEEENYDEITTVAELPGVNKEVAELLKANGIEQIQDFVEAYDSDKIQIEGVTKEALDEINNLINENVEFVEDEAETEEAPAQAESTEKAEEEEEYFCPECGAKITLDMTHCPKCGCEFEFAVDEE